MTERKSNSLEGFSLGVGKIPSVLGGQPGRGPSFWGKLLRYGRRNREGRFESRPSVANYPITQRSLFNTSQLVQVSLHPR